MTTPITQERPFDRLASALDERAAELTERVLDRVGDQVMHLGRWPAGLRDVMRSVVMVEIDAVANCLRDGSAMTPLAAREEFRRFGERLADSGLSIADVTRTFEITESMLMPVMIEIGVSLSGSPADLAAQTVRFLTDQVVIATSAVTRAYVGRMNELVSERRRLQRRLFETLLRATHARDVRAPAVALGLPVSEAYAALVASAGPSGFPPEVDRPIAAGLPGAWAVLVGSELIVLVPARSTADLDGAAATLRDILEQLLGRPPLIAKGTVESGLLGIRTSYEHARDIAIAARPRHHGAIVDGRDVVLERLLSTSPRAAAELHDLLAPLEAYDRSNEGALVETLAAFLANDLQASETARVLNVHRNTLRYRLDKIREVLGSDIADLRLPLRLAMVARRLGVDGSDG